MDKALFVGNCVTGLDDEPQNYRKTKYRYKYELNKVKNEKRR